MLREIGDDIWVAEQPLRFFGLELGARMTVARLGDGSLWIYSPIEPTDGLVRQLEVLGTVQHIVAPNRFHHLFAGEFAERFPQAQLYLAPGLAEKRPDLAGAMTLPEQAPDSWRPDLGHVFFAGFPFANEVVFVHRRSKSLLLCDLSFHIGPESPWLTRAAFRMEGLYGKFGPTRVERWLIRDAAAARESLVRILELDFDRIVVAHGSVLETGGQESLRNAFAWLLENRSASRG